MQSAPGIVKYGDSAFVLVVQTAQTAQIAVMQIKLRCVLSVPDSGQRVCHPCLSCMGVTTLEALEPSAS